MFRPQFLAFLVLPLLAVACYENNVACLDPDATNYDLLGDEACPDDCCQYPLLQLDVAAVWGESPLTATDTFTDGAGNDFRLLRFRFYLTDILLLADQQVLPTPENLLELDVLAGTDTVLTELNANLILVNSTSEAAATVGRLRTGTRALTQVQGTLGFVDNYPAVYPPSAPAASPLATQPGLLNFGNRYLQASAEYVLTATDDTVRVDLPGSQPLLLDFPAAVVPVRGANLTVEIAADYEVLFNRLDLGESAASVAAGIAGQLPRMLTIVGVR